MVSTAAVKGRGYRVHAASDSGYAYNCFDRQVVLTDKVGTSCNTIVAECPTEVIIKGESIYKSVLGTLKNIVKIKIILNHIANHFHYDKSAEEYSQD